MSLARLLSRKDGGVPSLVTIIDKHNIGKEQLHVKRAVLIALKSFEDAYRSGDRVNAEKWFRLLVRRYESPHSRKDFYIHPSELLNGCPRALVYKISKIEPTDEILIPFSAKTKRIFDTGTFYHRYIQDILKQAKEDVFSFEDEVPIRNEKLRLTGHCDGRLVFKEGGEEFLLEIKTVNNRIYTKLMEVNEPKEEHIYQASIYAKELRIGKILFLYINKDTSDMHTFLTEEKKFLPAQNEAYEKIFDINKHADEGKEWPRLCKTATEKRALSCRYCTLCFNLKM